jgi:hypothetical protein
MVWRYARWFLLALVLGLLVLAAFRIPVVEQRQQSEQLVDKIHSTRLSMADVDGTHLPPPPDASQKDATVAGVDSNQNGIRDDVELAIFAKYPNDTKLRAVALQYALTEQMFLTSVIDTPTWKAAAEQDSRAVSCVVRTNKQKSEEVTDLVETLTYNTQLRKNAQNSAYEYITSYGTARGEICDVEV